MPKGELPKEGETIRQPELAKLLKAIAKNGAEDFYSGWIAKRSLKRSKKTAV